MCTLRVAVLSSSVARRTALACSRWRARLSRPCGNQARDGVRLGHIRHLSEGLRGAAAQRRLPERFRPTMAGRARAASEALGLSLLDDLVGAREHSARNVNAQRFRGLEIDDEVEFSRKNGKRVRLYSRPENDLPTGFLSLARRSFFGLLRRD